MSALHVGMPVNLVVTKWLTRFYDYIGAYNHPRRLEHERDRARMRTVMPLVSIVCIGGCHLVLGTSVSHAGYIWGVGALIYGACSAAFWVHLGRHRSGGIHIQHVFLALDPIFVGWALYAAPEASAWCLVMMLVIVARTGFRYGLNAMKVELAFAWIGTSLPLLFGDYWHTHFEMAVSLVLMMSCAWWMFAPLNTMLERAKALDIESAKAKSLQDSLRAKSEFLSRVSHELRSPLQGVVSALDVIEERYGRDDAETEHLSRIRRGANALHTQLRDLLTLARGDVGKMEINPLPFEVLELASSVAREVRNEAWAKGLDLDLDLPQEPIFVVADAGRIDQVLTNLLTNATRHTKRGGVALTVFPYNKDSRALEFAVSDTGPGVTHDRIPTLFEPFTRFGEVTQKGEGAGLGLAVVRSVLDFLGGDVTVNSTLGKGTTFTVRIPAELLDSEPVLEEAGPRRILVVDDTRDVLDAISSVVVQLGFECDTAPSAAIAANLLGARQYDLVFVDLDMPVKTGWDLADETRRGKGPNANTRMLSISASDMAVKEGMSPFNGHLAKPISKMEIQRAIDQPLHATAETI